jgi:hypothetical protein
MNMMRGVLVSLVDAWTFGKIRACCERILWKFFKEDVSDAIKDNAG